MKPSVQWARTATDPPPTGERRRGLCAHAPIAAPHPSSGGAPASTGSGGEVEQATIAMNTARGG